MKARILLEAATGATYAQLLDLARTAEDAGFNGFFRSDHLLGAVPDQGAYHPTDSWTTLAGLARDTHRIRLGTLLTAATFRHPGLLATTVATVDEMSNGRIELGLGAGWYAREHEAFGIPFPPLAERFDRLQEQLTVVRGLWDSAPFAHDGPHYRLSDNRTPPRPAHRIPLIVGGAGPRRTPALAARHADEFNATFPDGMRERFAVFDAACERIGRDPATARHSVILPVFCGRTRAETDRRASVATAAFLREAAVAGTPESVVHHLRGLAKDGADTVYLHLYDAGDLAHLHLLGAEVLPHLA
ncbi:TIGR03560 family F420-dependent LLM class oxidoreductase [Streptomyces sp. NPDC005480]|uniref:TIGR03560 family F420-dependent LLM class oxidoreductase n=1 Tax=Streptomyces sp. NPDC005480 TaxID=3154880 RepID=UPI0033BEF2E4